jgi:hypothetical protein
LGIRSARSQSQVRPCKQESDRVLALHGLFFIFDTMEDTNFAASTESASPADSGVVDASATSASGVGEGQVASLNLTPESANAQGTAELQIDAGWSLDDETVTPSLPEDDADIEQMLGDPALDPARTPALVESLRNLRKEYRELHKQFSATSQQAEAFALYGGPDGALQLLQGFDNLTRNPQEGSFTFLSNLAQNAYPAYEAIANTLLEHQSEYFLEKLQERGLIPSQTSFSASPVDPDILATVPAQLQDVYKQQPAEARAELDLMSETARNHFLEREAKLNQLDATQRQQAEQQWQGQLQQARTAGQQAVESLSQQYEQAHRQQLAKWTPFGAESPQNQTLHDIILDGALNKVLADQKFAQMYVDTAKMLQDAPMRRLMSEGMAAGQDEIKARALAAQLNSRVGHEIKNLVGMFDGVFRDARAYKEQQQQAAPQRTEIKGTSMQAAQGKGVPPIKNGQIDPRYLERLAQSYGLGS